MFVQTDKMECDGIAVFLKECASMQGLRHPNVLGLIGVCVDHQEIIGPLIVSPFMTNGDLKSYLSGKLLESEGRNGDGQEVGRAS